MPSALGAVGATKPPAGLLLAGRGFLRLRKWSMSAHARTSIGTCRPGRVGRDPRLIAARAVRP